MEALWAPWRSEFIGADPPKGCIFCLFPAETGTEHDRKNLIIHRSSRSFVILNRYPYNAGHLMVVPRKHTADLNALDGGEFADLNDLLRLAVSVVGTAFKPEGLNVGINLGRAAGAGIADHLHYHVVPRWVGDTNFMPIFGQTKVVNEHLDATWAKLAPLFQDRG